MIRYQIGLDARDVCCTWKLHLGKKNKTWYCDCNQSSSITNSLINTASGTTSCLYNNALSVFTGGLSANLSVVFAFDAAKQPELVHGNERAAYTCSDGRHRDRAFTRARELVSLHTVHVRER
jgi:hypothetical protein